MLENIGGLMVDHRTPPPETKSVGVIVFVHGMWGGSWYFENWLQTAVADGYEVLAVNLRGHNGSDLRGKSLGEASILDYVEDVKWVIRILGLTNFAIIGHSMGGLIAQKVAEGNEDCCKAVFVTSATPRGVFIRGPVWFKMPKYLGPILESRKFKPTNPDLRDLMLNNMKRDEQNGVLVKLIPESGRATRDMILWRTGVNSKRMPPCLVIGGSLDRLTPPSMQRAIAAKYSARYAEFPNGHMLMFEEGWEKPIEYILNWLGSS